jgi:Domain of unknown function (DUF4253)
MSHKDLFTCFLLIFALISCKAEQLVEKKKPAPVVIVKPRHALLSQEERKKLTFPSDLITQVEIGAGAKAEPFFTIVVMKTENLKGEKGFEIGKLTGFSVHTSKAEELIESFRTKLRVKGYLIFKSQRGYGALPDVVTVIKGNNSYDLLKIQGTEAASYHLDTKAIIAWLKARQHEGPFIITGAGLDWLEARFIRPPKNMQAFAEQIAAFAPDVLVRDTRTVEKLAEQMERTHGFSLSWD